MTTKEPTPEQFGHAFPDESGKTCEIQRHCFGERRSDDRIGAGQMNRVGAAQIAIGQAGEKANGCVLASDAFFPFRDTVDAAAAAGVAAIVQPGGSEGRGSDRRL